MELEYFDGASPVIVPVTLLYTLIYCVLQGRFIYSQLLAQDVVPFAMFADLGDPQTAEDIVAVASNNRQEILAGARRAILMGACPN